MSDSYSAARISKGFVDLLSILRKEDEDVSTRIRANTEARFAAQERVRREYAAYGIEPPSDLALSITARIELGIGIAYATEEAA